MGATTTDARRRRAAERQRAERGRPTMADIVKAHTAQLARMATPFGRAAFKSAHDMGLSGPVFPPQRTETGDTNEQE